MKKTIDWSTVSSGTYFSAQIEGTKVIGKIQKVRKLIYLCQNMKNGEHCRNKHGFSCSWTIGDGSDINRFDVQHLKLHDKEPTELKKSLKKSVLHLVIDGHYIKIHKGYIKVGCTRVENEMVERIYKSLKK